MAIDISILKQFVDTGVQGGTGTNYVGGVYYGGGGTINSNNYYSKTEIWAGDVSGYLMYVYPEMAQTVLGVKTFSDIAIFNDLVYFWDEVKIAGATSIGGDASITGDVYLDASLFLPGILADTSTNKVLFFDTATGEISYADASFGVEKLEDINDVSVGDIAAGEFLYWNGDYWTYTDISLNDLNDASVNNPNEGQFLRWNSDASLWTQRDASLSDLADVDASTPAPADVLKWNGTKWAPGVVTLASVDFEGDLTIVDGSLFVEGDVNVDKNLNVDGSGYFLGNLRVVGTTEFLDFVDIQSGGLQVWEGLMIKSGDVSILGGGFLYHTGSADIDGNLNVDGIFQAKDVAYFWDNVDFKGDASIDGDLYVDGSIIDPNITNLYVQYDATIDGDLDIYEDLYVAGNATIEGTLAAGQWNIYLDNLIDVSVGHPGYPSNWDVLQYDASIAKWEARATIQVDEAYGVTPDDFIVPEYQYLGYPNVDGSWRFFVDASENLRFEKRLSGVWTYKYAIT